MIVRDLMFEGRHEYKDMLASKEGIASNILTNRLKKLAQAGIITSAPHRASKRRKLYYLTDRGKDLIQVMLAISRWSDRHLDDRVFIPEEKRVFLDNPPEIAAETVLRRLSAWEDEFITPR